MRLIKLGRGLNINRKGLHTIELTDILNNISYIYTLINSINSTLISNTNDLNLSINQNIINITDLYNLINLLNQTLINHSILINNNTNQIINNTNQINNITNQLNNNTIQINTLTNYFYILNSSFYNYTGGNITGISEDLSDRINHIWGIIIFIIVILLMFIGAYAFFR